MQFSHPGLEHAFILISSSVSGLALRRLADLRLFLGPFSLADKVRTLLNTKTRYTMKISECETKGPEVLHITPVLEMAAVEHSTTFVTLRTLEVD